MIIPGRKPIQPLKKLFYTNRWKIRKNTSSSLSFLLPKSNHAC
nr:MAG TPA: hypothetical protein [Caudoviricetes sp.]